MRYSYRPNDDEAACAWVVARRRNRFNRGGSNLPSEHSPDRPIQHYVACLSEIAFSRMANLCWTGLGPGAGTEPLKDVGNSWQVRCVTDGRRGLIARPADIDSDPVALIQVDTETRMCVFVGWALNSEVKEKGRAHDIESSRPCWILSRDRLNSPESAELR